jgi:hypothetical protein
MKTALLLASVLVACNVSPAATTGGADLPARGACPRGLALLSTDYLSSEIALLWPSGDVASSAFVSSASTESSGLAAPLSGDVVLAASRARPGELVTVDRYGTNVLTFLDTKTAAVRAQLPVGTGFEANAQSYVELSEHLAVVPRVGENADPGREPFDSGSDLLLLDPSVPSVVGSLPLPKKDGFLPHPAGATLLGADVLVTLQHSKANYSGFAEGELVAFTGRELRERYRVPLSGLKNCSKVEVSPSGARLAIACEGVIDRRGAALEPEASALLVLDALVDPPRELLRFSAQELFGGPIQASVEFVSDSSVLLKTQTALGAEQNNELYALSLETAETALLATAESDVAGLGIGIAFGSMSCNVACGDPCLVADRSRGRLLRFSASWEPLADVTVAGAGLPPTGLLPFW